VDYRIESRGGNCDTRGGGVTSNSGNEQFARFSCFSEHITGPSLFLVPPFQSAVLLRPDQASWTCCVVDSITVTPAWLGASISVVGVALNSENLVTMHRTRKVENAASRRPPSMGLSANFWDAANLNHQFSCHRRLGVPSRTIT
jgi:hypothetical protein